MRSFFSGTKFKIILCVMLSLLLGIFVAAVSNDGTSPVTSVAGKIFSPLNSISETAAKKLAQFGARFKSSKTYIDEINSLRGELESARSELADYYDTLHRLNSYEAFLEIKSENPDYTFEPTAVVLRDTGDFYGAFTIDKGSDDGIEVNDPVIYGKYLVGCVKEVSKSTAVVRTLLDPKVSVSAYEIRTREDCYTESDTGLAKTGRIRISGLSRSTPIVPGGIVCTSGTGGIFPKDLIIGTVSEVVNDETDISAYASVIPGVDSKDITDVFVITYFNGQANVRRQNGDAQ